MSITEFLPAPAAEHSLPWMPMSTVKEACGPTSSLLLFGLQEEEAIALVEAMLDANALELLVQVHQTFAPGLWLHTAYVLSPSQSVCAQSLLVRCSGSPRWTRAMTMRRRPCTTCWRSLRT